MDQLPYCFYSDLAHTLSVETLRSFSGLSLPIMDRFHDVHKKKRQDWACYPNYSTNQNAFSCIFAHGLEDFVPLRDLLRHSDLDYIRFHIVSFEKPRP
ncbi:hypothetical protein QR680_015438 [Steinernema hermaphroditum]|uniref:Uncharacterized protein n=1 Tax=Steinernema hermaphroditum TaxID=289476 RepID=A0AA39H8Q9_9BILA|nr:hypothetical protein QR680_015438 [Steinernema hermaphroditum]